MDDDKQVINGKVPSKSNSYRIIKIGRYCSLTKTFKQKKKKKSFYLQCDKYRNKMIQGLFELELNVYYENQRPDLDNCFKIVLDCLQGCMAIKNDRNCIKILAQKFIDKKEPRIEFIIKEV